jgi:hypothetical protein
MSELHAQSRQAYSRTVDRGGRGEGTGKWRRQIEEDEISQEEIQSGYSEQSEEGEGQEEPDERGRRSGIIGQRRGGSRERGGAEEYEGDSLDEEEEVGEWDRGREERKGSTQKNTPTTVFNWAEERNSEEVEEGRQGEDYLDWSREDAVDQVEYDWAREIETSLRGEQDGEKEGEDEELEAEGYERLRGRRGELGAEAGVRWKDYKRDREDGDLPQDRVQERGRGFQREGGGYRERDYQDENFEFETREVQGEIPRGAERYMHGDATADEGVEGEGDQREEDGASSLHYITESLMEALQAEKQGREEIERENIRVSVLLFQACFPDLSITLLHASL